MDMLSKTEIQQKLFEIQELIFQARVKAHTIQTRHNGQLLQSDADILFEIIDSAQDQINHINMDLNLHMDI